MRLNTATWVGRTALLATATIAIAITIALLATPAQAQSNDESTGRIVARLLENGRVEFGWQPASGERVLPNARYFPTDATVDRWLRSSPVEVGGAEIGRINARLLSDGRIEFGFTPTDGERIAPQARYFPTNARVGRWLRSTEITIGSVVASYTAISAGSVHSCAIRASDGAIECWGENSDGQTDAPEGSYTAIAAIAHNSCAIRASDGAIECWGRNDAGQLDAPAGEYVAIAVGSEHTCAIREDSGAIECWGHNDAGQLDAPTGEYVAIAAGSEHTCVIREDSGAIECWGVARYYLGWVDDEGNQRSHAVETGQTIPPAGSFTAVSVGGTHSCAIRASDAAIECWGEGYAGQLDAPAGEYVAIAVGSSHACAIRESDGAIECWGDNRYGQSDAPEGSFTAVAAGSSHYCAIRESDSAIECWGDNYYGQSDAPTE